MSNSNKYVGAGVHTYTAATRYAEWSKQDSKKLESLRKAYFAFTEKLGDWYGIPCTNDVSTVAILCTMLISEAQLMNDIDDIRHSPEWDEPDGDIETRERNTADWHRAHAFGSLVYGVMRRLGYESKHIQEEASQYLACGWCKGAARDVLLRRVDISPGELAEMCAERLPKQKLEELEVFATTLRVAKTLGVKDE